MCIVHNNPHMFAIYVSFLWFLCLFILRPFLASPIYNLAPPLWSIFRSTTAGTRQAHLAASTVDYRGFQSLRLFEVDISYVISCVLVLV